MSPERPAIDELARDVANARKLRRMTVPQCADAIGISASALRRIESGATRNPHGPTAFLILAWACSRGYRRFGGFKIEPTQPPRFETVADVSARGAAA